MELHKNIYCNTDTLVKGSTIKICYNGALVSNGATQVYLRYGYGENWDNTKEVKMLSTNLGFETELTLNYSGVLNFCLRDENNNWDNNNTKNYSCNVCNSIDEAYPINDIHTDNITNTITNHNITTNPDVSTNDITTNYTTINKHLAEFFNTASSEDSEIANNNSSLYPTLVNPDSFIEKIKRIFQRIANYVPKVLAGTWKRKKSNEN